MCVKRRFAGEHFVEQHAKAVDVRASVNIQSAHLGLLGAHVGGRAHEGLELGEEGLVRQTLIHGLGDAEVNDLGHRHAIVERYKNVRRLDVAMDDALLMRVLDGLADPDEQGQTLAGRQPVLVAVIRDANPAHQLHHEIWPSGGRAARIKHLGDVRVIHQRQGLPLRLESSDDGFGVHPRFQDLEGDTPPNRGLLLGHENDADTALADLLQQLVTSDPIPGLLANDYEGDRVGSALRGRSTRWSRDGWRLQKVVLLVVSQQSLDRHPQHCVVGASFIQERGALFGRWPFESLQEEVAFGLGRLCSCAVRHGLSVIQAKFREPNRQLLS